MAFVSEAGIGTSLSLASFNGTFVTGGQKGRSGLFIPHTEDTQDEETFLNGNDPFRRPSMDELDAAADAFLAENEREGQEEASLAQMLLVAKELTSRQIQAAALVMIDNPELLIDFYTLATRTKGIYDRNDRRIAQEKMFALVLDVAKAMVAFKPAKIVARSLALRRHEASGKTLLACLAKFARTEIKRKQRHLTANAIMLILGYPDVFVQSLD